MGGDLLLTLDSNGQSTGGDLGWFPRGIYSDELTNAAFEMEIGETRIIQDSDGWHVLQVTGHEQDRPPDSATREKLKSVSFNAWLEEVKANASITEDLEKTRSHRTCAYK